MPTKHAKPVIIETPYPSTEQLARTLRRLDENIESFRPRFKNPATPEELAQHKARIRAWESKLAREARKAAEVYRYNALTKWLRDRKRDREKVFFEDLEDEDKIGMNLPYAAWDRDWWT